MGICGVLATTLALVTVRRFPRKQLLFIGYIFVLISCVLIVITDITDFDLVALMLVIVMVMSFFTFIQPTAYLYMYEVGVDSTLGICKMGMYSFQLLIVLITPVLIQKLSSTWTFVIFGIFSLLGCIFTSIFVRETAGLNDKDKKRLYRPKRHKYIDVFVKTDDEANMIKIKKNKEKLKEQQEKAQ